MLKLEMNFARFAADQKPGTTPTEPRNKRVSAFLKRYFIDALGAMALGLFGSLIIGLILKQIFTLLPIPGAESVTKMIISITAANSPVVGAAIGVAIAHGLKSKPLAIYASAITGAIGYSVTAGGVSAGPVGAYVAAVIGAELGSWLAGKTKVDILVVPAATIISGAIAGVLIGPPIASLMIGLGQAINEMTMLRPLPMGMAVSAVMGMILTAPISSAALSIMLGISGLAAGAATAGCSAHMVGFAVASFRENKMAGLISQGIGTSMLQVSNIVRRPQIAVPAVVASLVTGALSTTVFKMENIAAGAGMGTSGLVGQVTTFAAMAGKLSPQMTLLYIAILHFILPAAIALGVSEFMRLRRWIRPDDMKLHL